MIAGPNGSGKSTLTNYLRSAGVDFGRYINADEIDQTLPGPPGIERSTQAQAKAEETRRECMARLESFSFETVMSHPSKIELLAEARALGYAVVIYFVALENPELNVKRVEQRVAMGGHPVPPDRIVQRYGRCLKLLPSALEQCDRAVLFDNSYRPTATDAGAPMLRAFCEVIRQGDQVEFTHNGAPLYAGTITLGTDMPHWFMKAMREHLPKKRRRPAASVRGDPTEKPPPAT